MFKYLDGKTVKRQLSEKVSTDLHNDVYSLLREFGYSKFTVKAKACQQNIKYKYVKDLK